jgi:hypothetical protein
MIHERKNVFAAFPQRRDLDRENVEPVKEILSDVGTREKFPTCTCQK